MMLVLQLAKDRAMLNEAIGHVDNYLLNPLQHAVAKDAPVELVRAMVQVRPELLHSSYDSRRRSLVHLAASTNADSEVGWVHDTLASM